MRSFIKIPTFFTLLLTIQFMFTTNISPTHASGSCDCSAATYTDTIPLNASGQRDVLAGELFCVTGTTTYADDIRTLAGDICIESTATFDVNMIQSYTGTITNFGSIIFNGNPINMTNSANLTNHGKVTFGSSSNLNASSNAVIDNKEDASIKMESSLSFNGNASVNNAGVLTTTNSFNASNNTSVVNSGLISTTNPLAISGTVTNTGEYYSLHQLNINTNATVYNECRLIAEKGFVNNATIENNGLVFELPTNTPYEDNNQSSQDDTFQNNGTWINGINGLVYGLDYSNPGTTYGGGTFYFEDYTTINGGSFGVDSDSNVINFYDAGMACSGAGEGPGGEFDNADFGGTIEEITCSVVSAPLQSHFPSACAFSPLNLVKTVGVTASECALADELTLLNSADVYYCYTIENLSGFDITVTSLVDDKIDLSAYALGLPVTLSGIDNNTLEIDSHTIILPATAISEDVINSATATGTDEFGGTVSASDTAFVDISGSAPTSVQLSEVQTNRARHLSTGVVVIGVLLTLTTIIYVGRKRQTL